MPELRVSEREGVIQFDVHVVPRASRSAVLGLHDGCLKIALDAPPVDGAANDALIALIAKRLGRPRRAVTLVRGHTSRRKTLAVEGATLPDLLALLPAAGESSS
jgi:uncharacterized protein (TIGR00251 family)